MGVLSGSGKHLNPFDLQIDLADINGTILTRNNAIKMSPRSTTAATAAGYGFSAAGDYEDPSNHNSATTGWSYDLKVPNAPSGSPWYNYVYGGGSGRRGSSSSPSHGTSLSDYGSYASLYMDLAVGTSPHPGIGSAGGIAHIAMLQNASGAYFYWQYTSPPPVNYSHARTLFDQSTDAHNIKISGQAYGGGGTHLYRQWFCLADRQSWSTSNTQDIRFINWGPNDVHIHGAKLIIHGQTGASSGADN